MWPGELLHSSDKYTRATHTNITVGSYMFNFKNRNTRTSCEICSKFTVKTLERLYCKLWTYFTPCSSVFIVNIEQLNAEWDCFCVYVHDIDQCNDSTFLVYYWKKDKQTLKIVWCEHNSIFKISLIVFQNCAYSVNFCFGRCSSVFLLDFGCCSLALWLPLVLLAKTR